MAPYILYILYIFTVCTVYNVLYVNMSKIMFTELGCYAPMSEHLHLARKRTVFGEISKTRGMHACIIMSPMATDNETDESIRLLASVSIATSGQTNQFLQYKQWFGNVKKMVTTQPSAPRMQSNSERMAGCVVAVNHNYLKHMIARILEFGVHVQ